MVTPLLVQSVSNTCNFHKLVLFICLLFTDGHFYHGHILYEAKMFEDRFLTAFDTFCPAQIPWQITDIDQHSLTHIQSNNRTDHILQLVFFNSDNFALKLDQFENWFTFYRLFIFVSTDHDTCRCAEISAIKQHNHLFSSSSLIVDYNTKTDSLQVHFGFEVNEALGKRTDTEKLLQTNLTVDTCNEHLFDYSFGEFERMQTLKIRVLALFKRNHGHKSYVPLYANMFFANYFDQTLNASHIKFWTAPANNLSRGAVDQTVLHKQRKYQKELLLEYESIDVQLNRNDSMTLHFDSLLLPTKQENGTKTIVHPLYPYHSVELIVMLVYGEDFTRSHMGGSLIIPESIQISAGVIAIFIAMTTIVLWILRRKMRLQRSGFILSFIDTLIGFISGGNLRMNHYLERCFFGILLISVFFINSLFTGAILNCVMRIYDQRVSTFEQLAEIDLPIYSARTWTSKQADIHEMLRFDREHYFMHQLPFIIESSTFIDKKSDHTLITKASIYLTHYFNSKKMPTFMFSASVLLKLWKPLAWQMEWISTL